MDGLFTAKKSAINPPPMKPILGTQPTNPPAEPLSIDLASLTVEDAVAQVGALTPLATASLEYILRNPSKFPSQAVAAAKLVYERKLGAVPDTVIQNNMQFIVKWED